MNDWVVVDAFVSVLEVPLAIILLIELDTEVEKNSKSAEIEAVRELTQVIVRDWPSVL